MWPGGVSIVPAGIYGKSGHLTLEHVGPRRAAEQTTAGEAFHTCLAEFDLFIMSTYVALSHAWHGDAVFCLALSEYVVGLAFQFKMKGKSEWNLPHTH